MAKAPDFKKAYTAKTTIKSHLVCDRRSRTGYPLCVDGKGNPLKLESGGCFFYLKNPAAYDWLSPDAQPGLYTWKYCPRCGRNSPVRFTGLEEQADESQEINPRRGRTGRGRKGR